MDEEWDDEFLYDTYYTSTNNIYAFIAIVFGLALLLVVTFKINTENNREQLPRVNLDLLGHDMKEYCDFKMRAEAELLCLRYEDRERKANYRSQEQLLAHELKISSLERQLKFKEEENEKLVADAELSRREHSAEMLKADKRIADLKKTVQRVREECLRDAQEVNGKYQQEVAEKEEIEKQLHSLEIEMSTR